MASRSTSEIQPRSSPAAGVAVEVAGWRFLVLVEITNYAMLRRHVGARRAETIASDVVAGLRSLSATIDTRVGGRNLIELHFHGCSRQELDAQLQIYEALFTVPVELDAEPHLIDVAIGAAAADKGVGDDVRLIEEAERALADAKVERRPVVRDVTQTQVVLDHLALMRDLPKAIETDQLFLQYQPKLHVRQQRVTSVEALVRWRHPVRGLILPNDFIPLAEQSRDIGAMTLWTIRRVIADQRMMAERGHQLRVFINVSGVLLGDPDFVAQASDIIAVADADIGFEITETAVIRDPQSAIAHLQMFADIGITIAIDDYGAGLSSLAYLKQLPARELKIDKLFVTQLTSSNRDPLIVRSTIDLAHALEMEVVAEGVETQASFALLSVMGCDMIQGFLISRPVGIDALITFLEKGQQDTFVRPVNLLKRVGTF